MKIKIKIKIKIEIKIEIKTKIKTKSSGQECPLYTSKISHELTVRFR